MLNDKTEKKFIKKHQDKKIESTQVNLTNSPPEILNGDNPIKIKVEQITKLKVQ